MCSVCWGWNGYMGREGASSEMLRLLLKLSDKQYVDHAHHGSELYLLSVK